MKTPFIALPLTLAFSGGLLATPASAGEKSGLEEFQLDALRVVRDPDGQTNLRAGPGTTHGITGQVKSGAVIAVEAEKNGWARRATEGEAEAGFLHTSRLEALRGWRETAAIPAPDGKSAAVVSGEFRAVAGSKPFKPSRHTITKVDDQIDTIDSRVPWGVDGGMPRAALTLTVTHAGKNVKIPPVALSDLYEPDVGTLLLLRPEKESDPVVLIMSNGDGAGYYTIAWSFSGGIYTGRAILPAP